MEIGLYRAVSAFLNWHLNDATRRGILCARSHPRQSSSNYSPPYDVRVVDLMEALYTRSYTGWTFPSEWSTSLACLPTGVCSARRQYTCQTVAFQSPKSLHDGIYAPLHVISWPYLDIVSASSGGGHLLSLVRWCSTLWTCWSGRPLCLSGENLTSPYHPGKTFHRLVLRPLMGQMCIPDLTTRLHPPSVVHTWVHTNNRTTPPPLSENIYLGSPTITLSVSPREHQLQVQINPGHTDLQIQKQGNPGDPSPELYIKL